MKKTNKNEELSSLIVELKKAAIDNDVKLWKRIAEDLEKPTRSRRVVNIYKLSKYTNDKDLVIVPGKVLGTGELTHKLEVAAYTFSDGAVAKINSNGKAMTIRELLKSNPKAKNIKIIG